MADRLTLIGSMPAMPMLPDLRLETYFSTWEFTARYHLTAADVETMPLGELLRLAADDGRARWESLELGYTPTYGLLALREAIAATYDQLSADSVLCFAGAAEPIYLAMQVLLGHGDHAVVLTPNYQATETVPLSICEVTGVALRPEDVSALDVDAVKRALRPATRVVAVNFPGNPTGALPDLDAWRRLVHGCDGPRLRLINDQIYPGLELPAQAPLPQAADLSPAALSLHGLSEAYGLPGLPVGWVARRGHAPRRRPPRAQQYYAIS